MEKESLSEIVGKNLSSLRKAKGLTQQQLAKEIHYGDKSISKWELGYALPTVDVLQDFASYYGVTVDYLISKKEEAEIEETVQSQKKKADPNKAVILAMTLMFVALVFLSIFFSEYFFLPVDGVRHYAWYLFIWMVPVLCFFAAIETWLFYHHRLAAFSLWSCFVWTTLLAFCFHFQFFAKKTESIWFILIVGVPLQVIMILAMNIHRKRDLK